MSGGSMAGESASQNGSVPGGDVREQVEAARSAEPHSAEAHTAEAGDRNANSSQSASADAPGHSGEESESAAPGGGVESDGAPSMVTESDEGLSDEGLSDEDLSDEGLSNDDVLDEIPEDEGPVEPIEYIEEEPEAEAQRDWYILKVQVNREDSIKEALLRRVRIAGLERFFGDVIVPTEDVADFKNGKRRIVKKKLYPGYLLVNMALNDETWFVVRETSGIGDFTGATGKPTVMPAHEVEKILRAMRPQDDGASQVRTAIPFKAGDRVRVKEGYFLNFEGEVSTIDQAHGRVIVMINIFGRPNPVELDHWQIEAV